MGLGRSYIATLFSRRVPRPPTTSEVAPADNNRFDIAFQAFIDLAFNHKQSISIYSSTSLNTGNRLFLGHNTLIAECEIKDCTNTVADFKTSQDLKDFEHRFNFDVVIQPNTVFRKNKRLVVFDMDSTLIQQEVIDEIAAFVGVKAQVAEITERAMRGELDFSASLRSRCAFLKGVPSTVFETMKENGTITFTPGARELCKALKQLGCTLAVLSGGFQPLADYVKEELNLDYAYANTLAISEDGQKLTGEVLGTIVDAERKAALLKEIAEKEGVDLQQVVAIGDGANDLVMMKEAGFGVAFNAKPKVQEEAPGHINTDTLQDVLYLFGLTNLEQEQLITPEKWSTKLPKTSKI
ncbi:hypothetical protein AA313_de0202840 [Arthrobotrys entomopaga]|nr:hypothetical protein AA313_de0202840 [Arthrobotrys entomopaga]